MTLNLSNGMVLPTNPLFYGSSALPNTLSSATKIEQTFEIPSSSIIVLKVTEGTFTITGLLKGASSNLVVTDAANDKVFSTIPIGNYWTAVNDISSITLTSSAAANATLYIYPFSSLTVDQSVSTRDILSMLLPAIMVGRSLTVSGGGNSGGGDTNTITSANATQTDLIVGQPSTVTVTLNQSQGDPVEFSYVTPPGSRGDSGSGSGAAGVIDVTTASTSGATYLLSPAENGDIAYDLTVTQNVAIALSSTATAGQMQRVYLQIRQTGTFTVTLPDNVKELNGTTPTITTTAGQIVPIVFMTMDGGTTWLAKIGF